MVEERRGAITTNIKSEEESKSIPTIEGIVEGDSMILYQRKQAEPNQEPAKTTNKAKTYQQIQQAELMRV